MSNSGQRLNYDLVARRYDREAERARDADAELVALCAARGSADGSGLRALDVCCGTGIQLVANRRRFPALRLTGLDLHAEMLAVAREKDATSIDWVQGDAAELPFAPASFDYVSAQFCLHHVQRKHAMLAEVARVLTPGGRFTLVLPAPWQMLDWPVYHYFPEALRLDERDFWRDEQLGRELERAGFAGVRCEFVEYADVRDLRARLAFFRERYSPSQLLAITDDEFAAGIARIEAEIAAAGDAPLPSESRVCIATYAAEKP